jgi:hypothetical protein
MAQKLKAAREFTDREFDEAAAAVIGEDRKLLERLAEI